MATLLLRHIDWLYTCDRHERVLTNAYVYAVNGRLVDIGKEPCPYVDADVVEELRGCIALPGLVSLHHHFFQSLTRAVPRTQRTRALPWLFGMYPIWSGIHPDALRWATLASAGEFLLTGGTTCADHSYLLPGEGGEMIGAEAMAAREIGVRLHLVRGCMPTMEGDLAERLSPMLGTRLHRMLDSPDTLFPRLDADVQRHHDSSRGSMLRVDLGPTGVTYTQPELMRRIAEIARAHELGLHTHFHPRPMEREACLRNTGKDTIGLLRDVGWLVPRAWYAHCSELSDEEIEAFADAGCGVAHCPRTVIRLGYQMTRIAEMRRRGVLVGLGIDGAASNDGGSALGDLRLALLLHRAGADEHQDPEEAWLTPYDALLMGTRVPAQILARDDIGAIEIGKCADVAAFDIRRVAYSGALADPLGGLLMCGSDASAALTVVNGNVVVRRGQLLNVDEARVIEETNRIADRMLTDAQAQTGIDFRAYPNASITPRFD